MFKRIALSLAVVALASSAGCSGDDTSAQGGSHGDAGPTGDAGPSGDAGPAGDAGPTGSQIAAGYATTTPIKHVVVIFQENVSFDHYFGTYPKASNPNGEPAFTAAAGTPTVNGTPGTANYVNGYTDALLTANPNAKNTANGAGAMNPFRLDPAQAATADQDHDYTAEESAYNNLAMDLFPKNTGTAEPGGSGAFGTTGLVMGYYDGNTVTALWNYAQHYAMSDNSFCTNFGPSTVGAINLISGQTNGAVTTGKLDADGSFDNGVLVPDGNGGLTDISDDDPTGDLCSKGATFSMTGKNVGDMLNAANISWGFFEGGFDLTQTNSDGSTGCKRQTMSTVVKASKVDYVPHHQPFQYYASTCNPTHVRPASVAAIGTDTAPAGSSNNCTTATPTANHQYYIHDFFDAVKADNMPAVSFLKAPGYQDGHAGYSDPLDEQTFITQVINQLQARPEWASTAVIIAYDDSDGWYDHASKIVNGSNVKLTGGAVVDSLTACTGSTNLLPGPTGTAPVQGRCGYGPRLPLLVISPYAKSNYVDHTLTDQSSILKFIEDNWLGGARIAGSFDAQAGVINNMFDFTGNPNVTPYLLNTSTGEPMP